MVNGSRCCCSRISLFFVSVMVTDILSDKRKRLLMFGVMRDSMRCYCTVAVSGYLVSFLLVEYTLIKGRVLLCGLFTCCKNQ